MHADNWATSCCPIIKASGPIIQLVNKLLTNWCGAKLSIVDCDFPLARACIFGLWNFFFEISPLVLTPR